MSIMMRTRKFCVLAALAAGLAALALGSGVGVGADLRLRHHAARHAQPHHRLGDRQGAEGKGRHERAGAADGRRNRRSSRWSTRGEADLGIANILEVRGTPRRPSPDLRLIGSVHALRGAFWVRKDSTMKTIADLKGKQVALGYSAMRTIDTDGARASSRPAA